MCRFPYKWLSPTPKCRRDVHIEKRVFVEKVWENIEKEQEKRGYIQIEGQSAQGSDKWALCTCIYIYVRRV